VTIRQYTTYTLQTVLQRSVVSVNISSEHSSSRAILTEWVTVAYNCIMLLSRTFLLQSEQFWLCSLQTSMSAATAPIRRTRRLSSLIDAVVSAITVCSANIFCLPTTDWPAITTSARLYYPHPRRRRLINIVHIV